MTILIDGDILAYRSAYFCEDKDVEEGQHKIDDIVDGILYETSFDPAEAKYEMFLTGKGNFRFDVQPTYKGNRKDKPKPIHLNAMRQYLIDGYNAKVSSEQEADDDIAIRATELGDSTIIASIDKDFLQVPCWHYNFNRKTLVKVEEYAGLEFFYSQVLMGDTADNVFGIRGVGEVKSKKMLSDTWEERELYDICVRAYEGNEAKVIENARLLWLRRKDGQIWQPPIAA